LMKTSSLASVISLEELLRRTELLVQVQFKVLEIFCVAALYYLLLTTVWGFIQQWLEAYASRSVASPAVGRPRATALAVESATFSRDAS
jgi:polar amino acid transport system permease protein